MTDLEMNIVMASWCSITLARNEELSWHNRRPYKNNTVLSVAKHFTIKHKLTKHTENYRVYKLASLLPFPPFFKSIPQLKGTCKVFSKL